MNGMNLMNRTYAGMVLLVASILVAGCDKEGRKLVFNHSLHVQDNGMALSLIHI